MPEIRIVLIGLAVIVGLWILLSMFRSIPQATVAVVTIFGKFRRVMREGANFKLPWENVFSRLSLQNRTLQMEFQAITQDQANVTFSTMTPFGPPASTRISFSIWSTPTR